MTKAKHHALASIAPIKEATLDASLPTTTSQLSAADDPVNKKFWLICPTSHRATMEDALALVTVRDMFNIFRGSLWVDKDEFAIFDYNQEAQAREFAERRLAEKKQKKEQEMSQNPVPESAKIDQLDVDPKIDPSKYNSDLKFAPGAKVKIPANVTADLKAAIKQASDTTKLSFDRATLDDRTGMERPADVDFYLDLLNAYNKIDALLKDACEESIKQLQMFIPSLPNWMTKEFPPSLIKFVASGGKPITLSDRFKEVKATKT